MKRPKPIIVLGARGNGIDIGEAVLAGGGTLGGFLDDDESLWNRSICGASVLGAFDKVHQMEGASFVLAVGNPKTNWKKRGLLARLGLDASLLGMVVHPRAAVSPSAVVGAGTAVLANASVGAAVNIDCSGLLLQGVVVGHDCRLGFGVAIGAGAVLSGGVTVGDGSYVGAAAVVKEGVTVGANALIGAGAVVIKDVPDGQVVVGNPARSIGQVTR